MGKAWEEECRVGSKGLWSIGYGWIKDLLGVGLVYQGGYCFGGLMWGFREVGFFFKLILGFYVVNRDGFYNQRRLFIFFKILIKLKIVFVGGRFL